MADIAVYTEQADKAAMFGRPDYVFKDGRLIVRDGRLIEMAWGATHVARPAFDRGIERSLRDHFERYQTVRLDNFAIADGEIEDAGRGRLVKYASSGPTRVIINGVEIEDTFAEAFGMTATRLLITADSRGMGRDRGGQPHRLRHLRHRLRLRGRHRARR